MNTVSAHMQTLCAPGSGTVRRNGGTCCIIDFSDEENGDVVSPASGTVTRIGVDGNRVLIQTPEGISVSVGIGELHHARTIGGEGCHFYVREGESVNRGQRLMHAGLSKIRRMGGGTECVMTVDAVKGLRCSADGGAAVRAGVTPLLCITDEK